MLERIERESTGICVVSAICAAAESTRPLPRHYERLSTEDDPERVLSIAGTDPSGGAGIQADLKTFAALGGYGMAVVTALVAQNTRVSAAVQQTPAEFVTAQLDTLFDDVRVDAVKIGMLANADIVSAVARRWTGRRPPIVVLDPVMVAAKRRPAARPTPRSPCYATSCCRCAHLITPNLAEAADLLGEPEAAVTTEMSMAGREPAGRWAHRGCCSRAAICPLQTVRDLVVDEGEMQALHRSRRIQTANTHGTGCTLSSAIATLRPLQPGWASTVTDAKGYLTGALRAADGLDVGPRPRPGRTTSIEPVHRARANETRAYQKAPADGELLRRVWSRTAALQDAILRSPVQPGARSRHAGSGPVRLLSGPGRPLSGRFRPGPGRGLDPGTDPGRRGLLRRQRADRTGRRTDLHGGYLDELDRPRPAAAIATRPSAWPTCPTCTRWP